MVSEVVLEAGGEVHSQTPAVRGSPAVETREQERVRQMGSDVSAPITRGLTRVRLFHEDCNDGMPRRLAPNSVDVVVTSPPYNLGIEYSTYDDRIARQDYLAWLGRWAEAVRSVLAEDGSVFL